MKKRQGKILVIDDNDLICKSLELLLKFDFESIDFLQDPAKIPSTLKDQAYDLILLDMNFKNEDISGAEGLFWLKEIQKIDSFSTVLMITAFGDIELAVQAMKEGATDFVLKPWEPQKLLQKLHSLLDHKLQDDVEGNEKMKLNDEEFILGTSQTIHEVYKTIEKVAETDANVLIMGESGTGKEFIAKALHYKSSRSDQAFVPVDLGAIPESLFESELFGHEKGAFTDAKSPKPGRFELAHKGTLFLDEIGNIPFYLQNKLLLALQEKKIYRVGSNHPVDIDVRFIAATNNDLAKMVIKNQFREDLYYRLNTIIIHLPPLRERQDDVIHLANHFLHLFGKKYEKPQLRVTQKACNLLKQYAWPGNIRELKHTIEKAVIFSERPSIYPEDLHLPIDEKNGGVQALDSLAEMEKKALHEALRKTNGNLSQAAKMLDISRTTLYSKMKKHGL